MLAAAEYPVIVTCRRVDSQLAMDNIVKLAETLGAAVARQRDRLAMPWTHPLNMTGAGGSKDGSARSPATRPGFQSPATTRRAKSTTSFGV